MTRLTPGPARLWLRATARRLGRAVTIVLSLGMMSLATTGALVGGDTLDALFTADAAAEWGAVDVEVSADDNAVMEERTGRLLVIEAGSTAAAGAPRLILQGVVRAAADAGQRVQVLGLGAEEQTFPPLTALAGTADPLALDDGGAIVNERLAERLGLSLDDIVRVTIAAPEWREDVPDRADPRVHQARTAQITLRVQGIAGDVGTADLRRTPNLIVRRDVLQQVTGLADRVTVTHLSAAVGGREGAEAMIDELAPFSRLVGLDLTPVLADQLALAEEEGGLFRSILLTLAILVLGAAAVATFGLLVALGEQRAREVAVLRALGVRRRTMAVMLVAESVVYGVMGAALGAVGGVPLGTAVSGALASHFADLGVGLGREQVLLQPVVAPASIAAGCVVVAIVAGLAGRSAARMVLSADTGDALRGGVGRLQPLRSRRRPVVLLALGTYLMGVGSVLGGGLIFIGLTVILGAAWARWRQKAPDPGRVDRRAAAVGLAWSLAGAAVLGDFNAGVQAGFGVLMTAGVAAIICTTVLLSPHLRGTMSWLRAYAPGGAPQVAMRTAASYAHAGHRRSATVMATLGISLFTLAAMSVLGSAQGIGLDRQSGGFDAIGTSIGGLTMTQLQALPEVERVALAPDAMLPQTAFSVDGPDSRSVVPYPVRLIGATGSLLQAQDFALAASLPAFPTARAALGAVLSDRDKAVLDRRAMPEGASVGDDVVIDIGSAPRRFRIVGVLDTFLLSGVFVNETEFGELVPNRGDSMVFASAAPGSSADQLSAALDAAGREQGLLADAVSQIRDDVIAVNRTFTDTFALMLVLAILVVVTSVAAYVVLAVRERRWELALLRALGLPHRWAVGMVAAEPMLTGALGALTGLLVGLVHLRVLFALGFSDLAFVIDWLRVALVGATTLVVLAITCIVTAAIAMRRDLPARLREVG